MYGLNAFKIAIWKHYVRFGQSSTLLYQKMVLFWEYKTSCKLRASSLLKVSSSLLKSDSPSRYGVPTKTQKRMRMSSPLLDFQNDKGYPNAGCAQNLSSTMDMCVLGCSPVFCTKTTLLQTKHSQKRYMIAY